MKRKIFLLLMAVIFLLSPLMRLRGQDHLMGRITGGPKKIPQIGAVVYWEGTKIGTSTDTAGDFMIAWPDTFPHTLIVKSIGFKGQGVDFKEKAPNRILINLTSSDTMQEITIIERRPASEFPFFTTIMAEGITQRGLRKAACCNLSESFETNPSVDAAMTDAVTGAKKIQLLGLDGIYSQILFENLPLIRGLSSSYGLSFVPGTWVNSIYITKGTGSVVNGYESIAGQLNIFLLQPSDKLDKLFLNAYVNQRGRAEMNVHVNRQLNTNVGLTVLAHASSNQQRNDMNHDGFLDLPLYEQYNSLVRFNWKTSKGWEGIYGVKGVYEDRTGGQMNFKRGDDHYTSPAYGIGIRNRQVEFFNKAGYVFEKAGRSFGSQISGRYHDENMFFGRKAYAGTEEYLYANLLWADGFENQDALNTGVSFLYDNYKERFNDSSFARTEIVPGIYFEYTHHFTDKFTMVAGSRADLHNIAGLQITPRLHFKYDIGEKTAIRVSGGKGFREANIFPENNSLFANSRQLMIETRDFTEMAWNYGGSIQQKFTFMKNPATFIIDFFRTEFQKQVIMNMETPDVLKVQQLDGNSYANSFQADLMLEPIKRFDVRLAYKFYDVWTDYDGIARVKPLSPRHRAFINLAYATNYDKWTFDLTVKWLGSARVPGYEHMTTPSYFLLSSQVGRKFPKLDLYLGAENILNYTQNNPILSAEDPFGPNFDATRIFAPTDGITIYAGFRFKLQ